MCRKLIYSFLLVLLSGLVGCASVEPNLIGRWEFDGNARDSSGNGHHGILMNGASIVLDDERGQVLNLDGFDDYVGLPAMVDGLQAVTFAMWIRINEEPLHGTVILNQEGLEPYYPGFWGFRIQNPGQLGGPPPALWFYTYMGGCSTLLSGRCGVDLKNIGDISSQIGKWMHLAVTYEATKTQFYVDGLAYGEPGTGYDHMGVKLGPATLGCREFERDFINAKFDDVRIYDHALSEAEIMAIYKWE